MMRPPPRPPLFPSTPLSRSAIMAGDAIPVLGIRLPNPLHALDQFWMPAATGLLFAMPFLLALWLLNQLPEPTACDIADRKSTRLNSSHLVISYAVFCLKKKT